jgi:excisionase family DNA binding protein
MSDHNPHKEIMGALNTIQAQIINLTHRLDKISPTGIMTRKQVAEEYLISFPTIHTAIKNGQLPSFKIGGSRRFRREDVEKWRG